MENKKQNRSTYGSRRSTNSSSRPTLYGKKTVDSAFKTNQIDNNIKLY